MEGIPMCPNCVHVLPPRIMRDFARPVMGAPTSCLIRGEANPSFEVTKQLVSLTRQLELLRTSWRQPQAYNPRWQAPFYPAPQQYPTQPNQPPRPSLEDTLQSFIQATQKRLESVEPSLEDTLQAFMQSTEKRFESVEASVQRIETHVGQIAETVGELVNQMEPGELPNQSEQAQSIADRREGKEIDNKVEETVPFSMHDTKAVPSPSFIASSSYVQNCSFINSTDLLAEKVCVQEHVPDERSTEKVKFEFKEKQPDEKEEEDISVAELKRGFESPRFEVKEKPPDDKEEDDLPVAELKRGIERPRFEVKEKPPDKKRKKNPLVPLLRRAAGLDRGYYFDPP